MMSTSSSSDDEDGFPKSCPICFCRLNDDLRHDLFLDLHPENRSYVHRHRLCMFCMVQSFEQTLQNCPVCRGKVEDSSIRCFLKSPICERFFTACRESNFVDLANLNHTPFYAASTLRVTVLEVVAELCSRLRSKLRVSDQDKEIDAIFGSANAFFRSNHHLDAAQKEVLEVLVNQYGSMGLAREVFERLDVLTCDKATRNLFQAVRECNLEGVRTALSEPNLNFDVVVDAFDNHVLHRAIMHIPVPAKGEDMDTHQVDTSILKLLLHKALQSPNAIKILSHVNKAGETLLHVAVRYRCDKVIRLLSESRYSSNMVVNAWDQDGYAPLHRIMLLKRMNPDINESILGCLFDALRECQGFDIDLLARADNVSKSGLHLAIESCSTLLVRKLIDGGARQDIPFPAQNSLVQFTDNLMNRLEWSAVAKQQALKSIRKILKLNDSSVEK